MKNKKLVVFIHGLSGSAKKWNNFSKLIESDGELNQLFDADFYEFPTSWFRLPFFRATPPIQSLAHGLSTDLENRFPDYPEIALICHSLGGLVGRHYLLSRLKNQQKLRISKLLLYATPNNGADLARVGKCLSWRHYQLRQLCRDSDFLDFLNTDWADLKVEEKFAVKYVIGLLDKLVDPTSARAHWGSSHFETIADKGHFNIVPPENCKALSFQIAKRFLLYHESPVAPNSPLWKHSLALITQSLQVDNF
jgi:pimeloyl-ACP methyl ester carboxylesterase